jgi:endo-1,4-beta-D-glucanase Y
MILAVYMNDQPLFDDLWRYEQQFLDNNGLMNWDIDPNGNVTGQNAATDADEDLAWALLQAD